MSFHVNNATEETENSFRPRVNECIKEAKQHLSVKSSLDLRGFNLKKLRVCNLDEMFCEHPSFNNLNILHFASAQGDIRLLEQVVAFGAAIDILSKNLMALSRENLRHWVPQLSFLLLLA